MLREFSQSRRKLLLAGMGSLAAVTFAPLVALAENGEDPEAIIKKIAAGAFDLFGSQNGTSNSWGKRRKWSQDVVSARFATSVMGEKAGGVFLKDFSSSKRRTFDILIKEVVVEFLLDIFAVYETNTVFTVDRVRPNRSNTATIMDTTVKAHGDTFKVKWTVIDNGGKCKISDVSIFGLNLVSDFRSSIEKAYREDGDAGVIAMLQTRVRRGKRKYPN